MNPFKVKKDDTIVPFRVEADGFQPYATSLVPSKDLVVEVSLTPVAPAGPVESAVAQVKETGSKTKKSKKKSVKDSSKSSGTTTEIIEVATPPPSKPKDTPQPPPPLAKKKPDNKISKGAKGTLLSEDFE